MLFINMVMLQEIRLYEKDLLYFLLPSFLPFLFFWFLLYPFYVFYYSKEGIFHYFNFIRKEDAGDEDRVKKSQFMVPPIVAVVLFILSPALVLGGFEARVLYMNNNTPNRKIEMKQAMTLAQEEPNTIMFYFDRCRSSVLAATLAYDYALFNKVNGIYKDNEKYAGTSFAELFPEFTDYLSAMTLGGQTNISNPSINASWYLSPGLKDTALINPLTNRPYNTETLNDWFATSYAFNFNLFKTYNYNNFNLFNIPYYGKTDYQTFVNSLQLQNVLRNSLKSTNINVFDRTDTVVNFGHWTTWTQKDDVRNFQNFGAHQNTIANAPRVNGNIQLYPSDINTNEKYLNEPNGFGANIPLVTNNVNGKINLSVSKTQSSNVIFFHNNFTHEPYSYLRDANYVSQYNPNGINLDNPSIGEPKIVNRYEQNQYTSVWWMVQKLKDICVYLKNLPYTGPNSDVIKNQYDNTNIYIISDHGFHFSPAHKTTKEVNNFLVNQGIYKKEIGDFFENFISNYPDYPLMNCTSFFKPRKAVHTDWNKHINTAQPLLNLFDFNTFITLGDLMPIIESELQKNIQDQNTSNTIFKFDSSKSLFRPSVYANMLPSNVSETDQAKYDFSFKDKIIMDPLNHPELLNARKVPMLYGGNNWNGNAKEYDVFRYFLFSFNEAFVQPNNLLTDTFYNSKFLSVLNPKTLF